ncbi:MAG: hypothetical protein JOZ05_09625 [Acetobacteraceae bacterium]|nr:hypothetical protein [Acetobacteraceae bacterium]
MATRTWSGPSGGQWGAGADWAGGAVPGAADDAVISGLSAASYLAVAGPGNAGSLTVLGNLALTGSYTLGALTIGTQSVAGGLLLSSALIQAGSLTLLDGPVALKGVGAQLRVNGSLTVGGTRSSTFPDGLDVLSLTGGASVQAGSVVLTGGSFEVNSIQVDAASTFEVGTAGGLAAGTLEVDANRVLSGAGYLDASAGIVDAGTITAQGGTLSVSSPVTGAGVLQIGAGATLALNAFGQPSTVPITFTGPNATLQVGAYAGALSATGLVSGFGPSDTIAYAPYGGALQNVTYASSSYGQGTLTLNGSNGALGSVRLAGDFSSYSFVVTPDANGTSDITLLPRATLGAPSPGTASPDAYVWAAAGSGVWGTAANWTDMTTASPAAVAPGVNDSVTLQPDAGTTLVSGTGNAAKLTVTGAGTVALNGSFSTGGLQVGTAPEGGSLGLAAGTTLSAATASIGGSGMQATGAGTRLSVTGTLTVAAPVRLTGGAAAQASGAALTSGAVLSVDPAARLEFGANGTVPPARSRSTPAVRSPARARSTQPPLSWTTAP